MESVAQLRTAEHWCCDGTFYSAPNYFSQVYSINCSHNHHVFSCLHAVLSNKNHSIQVVFFPQIKEYCGYIAPRTNTSDVELGAINPATTLFTLSEMVGCFLHFSQSFYRKIQSLSFQNMYATNK